MDIKKLTDEFMNQIRESVALNDTDYNIAKELSAYETEIDDYAYKYGDSDEEIERASSETKYITMKKLLNSKAKDFKNRTKLEYNLYISKYEVQQARNLKGIKPKTVEGKIFKLAMDIKKNTYITIIRPNGDYGNGLIMPFYEKDGDIFQKERFRSDIKLDVGKKYIKDFIKCINFYKDLATFGKESFRSIVSKNNKEARTEIDEIIKKYIPLYFSGFLMSPDNW